MPAEALLAGRLSKLGLPPVTAVRTHRNRTVMVSLTPQRVLRIHRGYAEAPDRVLRAIVRFLKPGIPRTSRQAARTVLLGFPVEDHAPPVGVPRREVRPQPGDEERSGRLALLHEAFNQRHFDGRLERPPIRLSGRMRTRLGEVTLERRTGRVKEIVISSRHLRRDGWAEAQRTLLHEMIHQWQAESGFPVDHGRAFRKKAVELGIEPRAVQGERTR